MKNADEIKGIVKMAKRMNSALELLTYVYGNDEQVKPTSLLFSFKQEIKEGLYELTVCDKDEKAADK
ncbi:MAG: hypothetical protein E6672_06280 [Negativicoccus succinicivorans]|nr:hypothetical protein [Negativicoccus succinicivorans]